MPTLNEEPIVEETPIEVEMVEISYPAKTERIPVSDIEEAISNDEKAILEYQGNIAVRQANIAKYKALIN